MRKLLAMGTLLLSSAAVFASPAVTGRGNYNQSVDRGYVAPAPVLYGDRLRIERERERLERLRAQRLRLERELARLRMRRHYDSRW